MDQGKTADRTGGDNSPALHEPKSFNLGPLSDPLRNRQGGTPEKKGRCDLKRRSGQMRVTHFLYKNTVI
ncbi:hypothetical protein HNR65_002692 [Desulfosalsimonas propionicica]|uniref:Uncharacterized protein n=1 Tax=Desulfosalsimonas propionicica TaxID=332175 RepID=A0A7W0HLJ1_9BACT|nr:hypothetical protein [Desulfosalsimonas propionicica]MBA2882350.1 hypothetical protein [Desulfosalsimonas propionicica]